MSEQPTQSNMSRRKMLTGIGTGGIALVQYTRTLAQETAMQTTENIRLTRYPTVQAMKSQPRAGDNSFAETAGFYAPGDGGAAVYRIWKRGGEIQPNGADVIAPPKWHGRCFGGKASRELRHVRRGRRWRPRRWRPDQTGARIREQTRRSNCQSHGRILDQTDQRHSHRNRRALGQNDISHRRKIQRQKQSAICRSQDEARKDLTQDRSPKSGLARKNQTRRATHSGIGPLCGAPHHSRRFTRPHWHPRRQLFQSGWAREEFFYVEEEGRVIGDIAWAFKNFTLCNSHALQRPLPRHRRRGILFFRAISQGKSTPDITTTALPSTEAA